MHNLAETIVAWFPHRQQQTFKRVLYGAQIALGRFTSNEAEFAMLDDLVNEGDWVVDIGANVGHYALKLSQLVGPQGRVLAFEPVPETFELLASNTARFKHKNVSLFNVALGADASITGMNIPNYESGMRNFYRARVSDDGGQFKVLCIPLGAELCPHAIKLAKIDAEGQELSILNGMKAILQRDRPVLIVEYNSPEITPFLKEFGYSPEKLGDSCNTVFRCS